MSSTPNPKFAISACYLGPVLSLAGELSKERQNLVFARNGTGKSFLSRALRYLDQAGDVDSLLGWLEGTARPSADSSNVAMLNLYERLKRRDRKIFDARRRKREVSPHVTAEMASIIKGMLERGDPVQTIAAWFGINSGRVSEIKFGEKFNSIPAATNELPPLGPYYSIGACYEMLGFLDVEDEEVN